MSGVAPRDRAMLVVAVAVALTSACGGGRTVNPFDPSSTPGIEDEIRVEVQNLNFNDATVYAMRQSQRVRLGRVTGKTDQTFRVQWNMAQPISFRIDVVSGRSCRTGQVGVDRGSRVWVTIPSDLGFGACRAGRR